MNDIDEGPYENFSSKEDELKYWKDIPFEDTLETKAKKETDDAKISNDDDDEDQHSADCNVGATAVELDDDELDDSEVEGNEDEDCIDTGGPSNLGPFDSFEKALEEANNFASTKFFVLIVKSSSTDGATKVTRYGRLVCDRQGVPNTTRFEVAPSTNGTRNGTSKRIGCGYDIRIGRKSKKFYIRVEKSVHNHVPNIVEYTNHPLRRRLTAKQLKKVGIYVSAGATPATIMSTLEEEYKKTFFPRAIYNAIAEYRNSVLDGHTPTEAVMSFLEDSNDYVYEPRINIKTGRLEGIFFSHKTSIEFLKKYPTVVVIDATYKTNRFGMPLVQIAGMTNNNRTFIIAEAFTKRERIEDYVWILQQLKKICFKNNLPKIISTDRDLALLQAIREELPESTNLLCRWHISKKSTDCY